MAANPNGSHQQGINYPPSVHGPAGDARSPRQPKASTESKVLKIIQNSDQENKKKQQQQQITLPVFTHKLSVDAKEFVPRARMYYYHYPWCQPGNSGEQSYDPSQLSIGAEEFYPNSNNVTDYGYNASYYQGSDYDPNYQLAGNFNNMNLQSGRTSQHYYKNMSGSSSMGPSTVGSVLDKFQETLYILTMHPGNMEEYLRPICEMIHRGHGDGIDVDNIVESLFQQSLQEANFRYTGARVCQYLSSNLKDTKEFTGFQKKFIKRCQGEFNKRDTLLNGSPEDQDRLRSLAMFMAEVFLNVETVLEDGTVERLNFLPRVLIDLLQCLLNKKNDMNVKSACQLYKLSGALIEDVVKNSPEQCLKFEDTFSTFQSLQTSPEISEDVKQRVASVVSLKESNWNRNVSSPPKKYHQFTSNTGSYQRQEPVFFNNQGVACTREEAGIPEDDYDKNVHILNDEEEEALREFEREQDLLSGSGDDFAEDGGFDAYNYDDAADDGCAMGAEEEAAYEEFLQEQYRTEQSQMQQQQHLQQNNHYNQGQQYPQSQSQNIYYNQPPPAMPQYRYNNAQQQQQNYQQYNHVNQQQPPQQQQHNQYMQPASMIGQAPPQLNQMNMPYQQHQGVPYQQSYQQQQQYQQYNNDQNQPR